MHKYIRLMGSMVVQEYLVCAFFFRWPCSVLVDGLKNEAKKTRSTVNVEEEYTE